MTNEQIRQIAFERKEWLTRLIEFNELLIELTSFTPTDKDKFTHDLTVEDTKDSYNECLNYLIECKFSNAINNVKILGDVKQDMTINEEGKIEGKITIPVS